MHLCPSALVRGPYVLDVRHDVRDMNHPPLDDGSPRRRSSIRTYRIPFDDLEPLRRVSVAGRDAIEIPVLPVDEPLIRGAELHGILDQTLQHRLETGCGAADDVEDLGGRGLLRQRFRQPLLKVVPFADYSFGAYGRATA
jgi:hypothetical protein